MTDPTLFDTPTHHTHHRNDPATSITAANTTQHTLNKRCAAVYHYLQHHPSTADELDDVFPQWPPRTAARRISDLRRLELIRPTGHHRPTRYGQPAIVWTTDQP